MSDLQNTVAHFHIKLNKNKKGIKTPDAIETCQYFNNWNHTFHKHGKFIIIKQSNNI